jgi:signal transduction histidine kinase/HD-GYP domain-containing protein (c-di-GMP phosphodiesterase class II)
MALLAQAVLALRSTADLGTAAHIAGDCAVHALDASGFRLLRVDPRSGAMRLFEPGGVETPYLAEPNGAVEWVLRQEKPLFDDGSQRGALPGETLLWSRPPCALAALPLQSRSTAYGCLLVAFDRPHDFGPAERLFLQTLGDALALLLEREELRRQLDEVRRHTRALEGRLSRDEESAAGLVTAVAHEMQAPVGAIQAYAESLHDALDNPHAPRQRFLATIQEECERLARLLTDILELSRIEVGARPLRVQPLELHGLWAEAAAALRPDYERRRIAVKLELPKAPVEADAELLRQLCLNLLGHAVRHAPTGGTVRVRGAVGNEEWEGSVEDDGPPVGPDDLARVFDRFSHARRVPGMVSDGAGLELAIARGIVELHGGRIEAESDGVAGCRLRFHLPLRQVAGPRARRIAARIAERADLRELFEAGVEMVAAMMEAEICSLMLVHPEHGDLFVVASVGLEGQDVADRRVPLRAGVAGTVAAWGKPVRVENIETDRRFRRLNHPQYSTKSLLCVPMHVDGEVLGVVNVSNKRSKEPFSEDDLAVLVALVERVGGVVERAVGYPDGGASVHEALGAVRSVTRLRRECRLGSPRLVRRVRAVAQALLAPPAEVDVLGYVASVHDVGMTRLEGVLPEATPLLEADERHAVMQHPEVGVEVIRPLEYQGVVRDIILAHHEWWDGSGYPRGLKHDEIPLGARILAVVDAYESMVSGRSYRAPMSSDEALAELRRHSGRQFDPDVVETLSAVIEREKHPW